MVVYQRAYVHSPLSPKACPNCKYQFDRANEPANSNVNLVTRRMEWHAIVRGKLSPSFRVTGARVRGRRIRKDSSKFIAPPCAKEARAFRSSRVSRSQSRNFANFDAEDDKDRHYCYASRIENFLISHQPRSIPSRFPGLSLMFNLIDCSTRSRRIITGIGEIAVSSSQKLSKNY